MKKLGSLIFESFFFRLTFLRKVKQDIYYGTCFFQVIINIKVVLGKFLNPTNLSKASALSIHELPEIFLISKDENLVFAFL